MGTEARALKTRFPTWDLGSCTSPDDPSRLTLTHEMSSAKVGTEGRWPVTAQGQGLAPGKL